MTMFEPGLTRRTMLRLAGAGALYGAMQPWAWAMGQTGLHGLSVFGDLKYPAGFSHFDYLDPDAPKGGRMHFQPPNWVFNQNVQTFNTLNTFVLRGDAPPRMGLCFDSLMVSAADEPDSIYGLVATTVDVSDDGNVFTFHLRPEARFHDATPLTAEDVAFSLMLLKKDGHPNIAQVIREMVSAEARDVRTVVVTLSGDQARDTILSIAGLPIFSKAYYGANDFLAGTLNAPLSSGPYRVGRLSAGRFIEYERVVDYWAADLPVSRGSCNFDVIRIDFFTERQAAFEAFKKGEITFREEFTAMTWAKDYNFPAVMDGKVFKSLFPGEKRPSYQGWFINTRRAKFSDPRTREAIGLAFDFEWSNRNLFFDAYTRLVSYFEKSEFAADGRPTPEELALLEPFRAQLPESVFGDAYVPPRSDGSGRDRVLLRRASELLSEAGWTSKGSGLVDAAGNALTVEFLIDADVFERVLTPYVANLKRIGIAATIRQVDPVQMQSRTNEYDFDITMSAVSLSPTPLDGLQQMFGSRAADTPGTYNLAGMRDPVVDALLARVPAVSTRDELIALTRTIDRVLRASHYWVSNWYRADHNIAHWNLFGWPAVKPDYAFTPDTDWWFDRAKAEAIGMAG